MLNGPARQSVFACVVFLCCVGGKPIAAQTSKPKDLGKPPSPSMPSAVSPEIERFVQRSGRDLPNTAAPPRNDSQPTAIDGATALPTDAASPPSPAEVPSPLATSPNVKPAPVERTDLRFPINLSTALRLSDARPIIVAAAQARVWVAEAALTQAKVLWIPELNIGFDYVRHDGGGPDFNKGILTTPSVNFFYGGAGLYGVISTTDAIFQPLVSRQILNSRQWDVQTAKNDALMETADAYFKVHQYRGMYAGALYTVERGRELVSQIGSLSRDLVSGFEVDRARNMLADLEQQSVWARQQWRVESAGSRRSFVSTRGPWLFHSSTTTYRSHSSTQSSSSTA